MVWQTQGVCIEEERKALLEIKAYLIDSYDVNLLPTWVDDGQIVGRSSGECCDWERVTCNTTTGHVTNLSLNDMMGKVDNTGRVVQSCEKMWSLNVSLFLQFKELTSLNLSFDCLDNNIVSTELGRLSSLKKFEIIDLSGNSIGNDIFPSLGAITSLRVLHLGDNNLEGYFPALALEDLEILDLTNHGYAGTQINQMQGFERVSKFKKLKILKLGGNGFNESLLTSLSALPLLKVLELNVNSLFGLFPAQELAHLINLEELDLSSNELTGTPSIQDCSRLSRLKKLKSITLEYSNFNKSIISCLSALPYLKILDLSSSLQTSGGSFPVQEIAHLTNLEELDLSYNILSDTPSIQDCSRLSRLQKLKSINLRTNSFNKSVISCLSALPSLKTLDLADNLLGGSFPIQEISGLRELERLDLSFCHLESLLKSNEMPHLRVLKILYLSHNSLNGTLPMEALASFHRLEVLDLSWNQFVGSIPSTIRALSSLRVVSFAYNNLTGMLPYHGLCELKNLYELDLSHNMFDGEVPQCFNSLSSLKLLDISSNQFTRISMSSPIANLTSLEYVDFSNNKFEGSFSFKSLANHAKLEVVVFICDNGKFEVETEEPRGWIPMFQLKVLVLSNCNVNRAKGSVVPGFLLHQHKLRVLDLSHNSLVGEFPNWLIKNNTMLEGISLRNNSFGGYISMLPYKNANTRRLDMSRNHMNGTIPHDIQKFLPNLGYLNLSSNSLDGVIPSSIVDLSELWALDLSDNELSEEVPKELFTDLTSLQILKLSNNMLHGQVLSRNLSLGNIQRLHLDSNCFTGKIGNETSDNDIILEHLDISNNFFTGMIPHWVSNMSAISFELMVRNNSLEGRFPCGTTSFSFLDISQNSFSGPIPSCVNFQNLKHLHLGFNKFTGSIPNSFRKLTEVLTLDVGNNLLSGKIPKFLGELSHLRILILKKNNFSGSIPKQLCQLRDMSLIDLSSNSLSGSIPSCLQHITTPIYHAFEKTTNGALGSSFYHYVGYLHRNDVSSTMYDTEMFEIEDEVQFTTKALSLAYKGSILDYLVGLDLSDNKLTGEIPKELGLLTEIHSLNLSHNQLSGPIPMQFSNLVNIESLDLSSNGLSGKVPSQLIQLTSLAVFSVSYNNLSGRLPEMKAQFGTFTKESYEGNPLLCGPPLEKKCTTTSQVIDPSAGAKEDTDSDKWYDIDMVSFYGSSGSAWAVSLLGFAAVLYINPYWRRRWLDFVEDCMYTCYYFLDDCVRKLFMFFRK
ncbi:hypothetical protein L6452_33539 [Arctium lappa]|uniref:Uncharacterized protein n=1 Tax=Arctium lappa TaxID=4217 RepID=A0ACB8YFM4_ARCLA|nr:hypothetical protein L6452_33539 [Arctium lappa]